MKCKVLPQLEINGKEAKVVSFKKLSQGLQEDKFLQEAKEENFFLSFLFFLEF